MKTQMRELLRNGQQGAGDVVVVGALLLNAVADLGMVVAWAEIVVGGIWMS